LHATEGLLVKEAYTLSKQNVEQWKRFLSALELYTRHRLERGVCAPALELQVTAGMARQALDFYSLMRGLDEAYEKLRK
jgi:hypothetical protein